MDEKVDHARHFVGANGCFECLLLRDQSSENEEYHFVEAHESECHSVGELCSQCIPVWLQPRSKMSPHDGLRWIKND